MIRRISISLAAMALAFQLEFYGASGQIENKSAGYETLQALGGKAEGIAPIAGPSGSRFNFKDEGSIEGDAIKLSRTVEVSGTSSTSF